MMEEVWRKFLEAAAALKGKSALYNELIDRLMRGDKGAMPLTNSVGEELLAAQNAFKKAGEPLLHTRGGWR